MTLKAVATRTYPRQRVFGLFLCIVAVAVLMAIAFPYQGQPNGALFGECYAVAFLGFMMNPFVRRRMGAGPSSQAQQTWSNLGLGVLAIGCAASFVLFASDSRTLWLALLLTVGVHFLFFVPCTAGSSPCSGPSSRVARRLALYSAESLSVFFFVLDGALKLVAGILYLRLSTRVWD